MHPTPVDAASLPPFSNMRARCSRCGAGYEIRVNYDKDCAAVNGPHFHRICSRCGHSWVEQSSEHAA